MKTSKLTPFFEAWVLLTWAFGLILIYTGSAIEGLLLCILAELLALRLHLRTQEGPRS